MSLNFFISWLGRHRWGGTFCMLEAVGEASPDRSPPYPTGVTRPCQGPREVRRRPLLCLDCPRWDAVLAGPGCRVAARQRPLVDRGNGRPGRFALVALSSAEQESPPARRGVVALPSLSGPHRPSFRPRAL